MRGRDPSETRNPARRLFESSGPSERANGSIGKARCPFRSLREPWSIEKPPPLPSFSGGEIGRHLLQAQLFSSKAVAGPWEVQQGIYPCRTLFGLGDPSDLDYPLCSISITPHRVSRVSRRCLTG